MVILSLDWGMLVIRFSELNNPDAFDKHQRHFSVTAVQKILKEFTTLQIIICTGTMSRTILKGIVSKNQ